MKTLLCHPRLDIAFKNFGTDIPEINYSSLPPIRKHWANCFELLKAGENVTECIRPMWEFDDDFYRDHHHPFDRIIVPHRQCCQFDHLGPEITGKMRFLMQTVFPERFTLDSMGWGANMSFLPLPPKEPSEAAVAFYQSLTSRIQANESKFEQPPISEGLEHRFDVLFVCQLPHDETIKFHSDVSVENTLEMVLEDAKSKGWKVLVKGHPVNPGSMLPLQAIASRYENAIWTDSISIHDAIRICDVVALVNSGVGFEAMLHGRAIFSYGRSEYQNVVNYKKPLNKEPADVGMYQNFLYEFFESHTLNSSHVYPTNCIVKYF